jgi:hypothetical protein
VAARRPLRRPGRAMGAGRQALEVGRPWPWGQAAMAMEGRQAAAMAIFYRAYGIGLPRLITVMWTDPYGFGGAMGRSKGLPVWSGMVGHGKAMAWPKQGPWHG